MMDLMLKNGLVITMDKARRALADGCVVVDKGAIVDVGATEAMEAKYQAVKTIDCKGRAIMPGFVDAHGHAGHTFFRYIVRDTKYWMPAMTHTYKHYVTDDFWYHEGRLSALERLRAGVTTGVCVMGSQPRCDDPIHALNNARAYAEVGIRDIVCTGPCHVPWPHNFSRWVDGERVRKTVTFEECVKSLETVIKTLHNTNNGKTFAYVTPFGIITSINPSGATPKSELTHLTDHDKLQAKEMLRVAKEYNTRIHSDCFGGMLHLAMEDLPHMVLGPHVHVQHCSRLSPEEVQVLADTGTHASAAPSSGAPVDVMLDKGVNIVLSTDGAGVGYGFDMFLCMRAFQASYRNYTGDGSLLPYERLLEMATIDAARAVGLDHMVGSLEVGKRADIITVNLKQPRLTPLFNPVHALVLNARGDDVDNVIVDGEFLLEEGRVTSVEEDPIYEIAQREAEATVERAKLSGFAYLNFADWGQDRVPQREEIFDLEWQRQDGGHY